MRILVTGGRAWTDKAAVADALMGVLNIMVGSVVVHGDCPTGADAIAEQICFRIGTPTERHPANWKKYGRAAGPIRNQEMVDLGADICLAFLQENSRGTADCIKRAKKAGIPVKIYQDQP